MAEFQVVMREVHRMCKSFGASCIGCPLHNLVSSFQRACKIKDGIYEGADFNEVEAAVMKWANEHPEPRYPSLNDAWKQLFPDACSAPCPKVCFGQSLCLWNCKDCRKQPIEADIAEKLGIKPIGGNADA